MSTHYTIRKKQYPGIGISLLLLFFSCGKKFENPNGNQFLEASVAASPLVVASDSMVTITGHGFSPDPSQDQVFFNGVGAAVLQANATSLTVKVPAQGSTGPITVRVNGEQANGPVFTYANKSAFSISPSSGIAGTTVTLIGNNVGPAATTTVTFGNLPGKVIYTDSSRIIVTAPGAVQTNQVTINTNGSQYAGPVFTLCTITSISPVLQGAGVGTLRIIGTGFNPIPGKNTVTFPTNPQLRILSADTIVVAPVIQGNADTLVVNIPANAGTGAITVNPNSQNTIVGPVFTLFVINSVAPFAYPYVASSGFLQLLTGLGFNTDVNQNHLTVNGLSCTISRVSPTGDSLFFYPPDLINPAAVGTANGPIVLRSGGLTTTYTASYSNQTNPTTVPVAYIYQEVSTLAGGSYGLANGKGRQAQFETLSGIATNGSTIYVTDKEANNVRAISNDGTVTLLAGSPTGQAGYQDGIGAAALFNAPCGVAYDYSNNLLIADSGNFRIRKINLLTNQVTTIAGSGGRGFVDAAGTAAQFTGPNSIAFTSFSPNTFLVTDINGGQGNVRQVLDDGFGTVSTVQPGLTNLASVVDILNPDRWGILYFSDQALYASNYGGYIAGVPGTTGFQNAADGTTALFKNPNGIAGARAVIPGGTNPATTTGFLISDQDNNVIRIIDLTYYPNTPYPVTTYIGGNGGTTAGYQDGGYRTALFNRPGPMTIAYSSIFYYYVCDVGNHAIRVFN